MVGVHGPSWPSMPGGKAMSRWRGRTSPRGLRATSPCRSALGVGMGTHWRRNPTCEVCVAAQRRILRISASSSLSPRRASTRLVLPKRSQPMHGYIERGGKKLETRLCVTSIPSTHNAKGRNTVRGRKPCPADPEPPWRERATRLCLTSTPYTHSIKEAEQFLPARACLGLQTQSQPLHRKRNKTLPCL